MSEPILSVEHLSKRYQLGGHSGGRDGLRHKLERFARLSWLTRRSAYSAPAGSPRDFWALRDVSFGVRSGDAVAIIGRNGAGKSTLLKVLSRITEPTGGRVRLRGRVASLLEVGTGFHQELTGRENIYLNGAILGMTRAEIKRKFDAIVAFSEVERFIDTPVKRYSSGMYVRLAFAVAAHLEPEILIVDEVLAVGDIDFQRKCLGKMGEVASSGRTVLFVSHNMAAVQALCTKSVLLHGGRVKAYDDTAQVVQEYLKDLQALDSPSAMTRTGNGVLRLESIHFEDMAGTKLPAVSSGMDCQVVLSFRSRAGERRLRRVDPGISIHLADTTLLAVVYASYGGRTFSEVPTEGEFRFVIRKLPLKEGRYFIGARVVVADEVADYPDGPIGVMNVIAGNFYGSGSAGFDGSAPWLLESVVEVTGEQRARSSA